MDGDWQHRYRSAAAAGGAAAGGMAAGGAASGPGGTGPGGGALAGATTTIRALELPWTERGVIVCGDGCADPAALLRLAGQAGWPVLAEPSSGARTRAVCPGRVPVPARLARVRGRRTGRPSSSRPAGPGLSRAQLAYLKTASPSGVAAAACGGRPGAGPLGGSGPYRHRRRRRGPAGGSAGQAGRLAAGWRRGWPRTPRRGAAVSAILDADDAVSEPRARAGPGGRPCRTAPCCGPRPACPSVTWISRWRRGPGASGCWPAGVPAVSTA